METTKTPMQDLFERFGHLLPDIKNEYLEKERVQSENKKDDAQNEIGKNVVINNGEVIGKVLYKTTLYVIEDDEKDQRAFAKHDGYHIFDVENIEKIELTN